MSSPRNPQHLHQIPRPLLETLRDAEGSSRPGLMATSLAALSSAQALQAQTAGLPQYFQMLLQKSAPFPHVKAASCPSSPDNTRARTQKQL